jgi:D-sedoheptulose 7-phosphate isomerase
MANQGREVCGVSGALARTATAAELFERRVLPLYQLADDASAIAAACHAMAVRFHRGGTLVVFGNGTSSTDAQHVVVEFVHPVIMGKRALPAISLTADVATVTGIAGEEGFDEVFAHQLRHLASTQDIALGISPDGNCGNVLYGLAAARQLGMLTIALVGGDGGRVASRPAADHVVVAHSDDPRVIKEVHVTAYHVLWELVHVFLQHPDLLAPRAVA